jgi:ubiquinone biosynthesis protein
MAVFKTVGNLDRLRQITQVLFRHGFGELARRIGLPGSKAGATSAEPAPARPELAPRLRMVLQDLGTTFVKLGQVVSTRTDLLPADIISELKKLQDSVPPFEGAVAREQIEAELGEAVEAVFASFEEEPLASASVAQVHRAELRLPDRETPVSVAVKVQRPGIGQTIERDLQLLQMLARLLERGVPEVRVYRPTGLVREFEKAIRAELDFKIEADNIERFIRNFEGEPSIRFPRVYWQASAKRVLTLEYLDGLKVTEAVHSGASGEWIANTAVRLILKMVFEDGFFHADPHPGNVLILPRPSAQGYAHGEQLQIGMLDLGLIGRLSPQLRDHTLDLLLAAANKDGDALADAVLAIAKPRGRVDRAAFRAHVGEVAEAHLGRPLEEVEVAAVLRDVVKVALRYDLQIPPELTMLFRAIMTTEGVGKEVYPALDVLQVAQPYLAAMVMRRYHPARLGQDLLKGTGRLAHIARELPDQLRDIVEGLHRGDLTFRAVDPDTARALDRVGKRLRASLISLGMLGSGVALLLTERSLELAYGLIGAGALWLLGHLISDREGRGSR